MKFALLIAAFAISAAAQVLSGSSLGGIVSQTPPFFYYVDTINGNDAHSGKVGNAWQTTNGINSTGFSADTVALSAGQVISYKTATGWEWYRTPGMLVNQTQLTVDVMTGACDVY